MKCTVSSLFRTLILVVAMAAVASARAEEELQSWNEGHARKAIFEFVSRVTDRTSADYVPASERIAVFDNDGTLWAEQPIYIQLAFAIDEVRRLAPQHANWKTTEPFASLLEGDFKGALAGGERAILEIVMATHTGNTADEFSRIVDNWISSAQHPVTGRPYTSMVYQPMLELLVYLRSHGFKTYIVSGGGIEFMRVFSEDAYGIPPEQVIGSTIKTAYELRDDRPVIVRLPELEFLDDKQGKPVAIYKFIGRRPIAAFGNSDGDLQMLQWTAGGKGARLMAIVHHTDADREWSYDRESPIGHLDTALDEAESRGWTVIDMKKDWKVVYPSWRRSTR